MPVTEMEHLAQAFQRLLDSAALHGTGTDFFIDRCCSAPGLPQPFS
jgi:hypothetical protein